MTKKTVNDRRVEVTDGDSLSVRPLQEMACGAQCIPEKPGIIGVVRVDQNKVVGVVARTALRD